MLWLSYQFVYCGTFQCGKVFWDYFKYPFFFVFVLLCAFYPCSKRQLFIFLLLFMLFSFSYSDKLCRTNSCHSQLITKLWILCRIGRTSLTGDQPRNTDIYISTGIRTLDSKAFVLKTALQLQLLIINIIHSIVICYPQVAWLGLCTAFHIRCILTVRQIYPFVSKYVY
jgi:hypothetical protein